MVCQNQSIDDSEAPLARDLRILVRERLKQGDSDTQVLDYLTTRYGEFVLLKPPLAWHTALLWFSPLGLLIIGAIGLGVAIRRRSPPGAGAASFRLRGAGKNPVVTRLNALNLRHFFHGITLPKINGVFSAR